MKKYLILSLILHILLISLIKIEDKFDIIYNPYTNNKIISVEFYERFDNLLDTGEGIYKQKNNQHQDCKNFFGGIGITHDFITDKIIELHAGYPAEKSGLVVGDIVKTIDDSPIIGEIGTPVILLVIRNGNSFVKTIIRGKICVE